jgi:hypothetical protein
MIYKPRRPALWDRAALSDPLTRDLKALWCFGTGHHGDLSGQSNALVSAVNPTWDDRGLTWNKNGYLDFGNPATLQYADSGSTTGYSLECVFQLDQTVNGEQQRLISKMGVIPFVGSHGFELFVRAPDDGNVALRNRITFRIANTGTDGPYSGATEILVGRKYHVLITKAPGNTNPRIYLNGAIDETTPGAGIADSIPSTSTSFLIGAAPLTLSDGIRGAIEKVAVYGRALNAVDAYRLAQDPYCHFGARKLFLFGAGQAGAAVSGTFDWDLSLGCSFELPAQAGEFECDASIECSWDAPQPSSFWTCDIAPGAEFSGHVGAVGRVDALVDIGAEFSGRVRGAVAFEADLSLECSWIVGAAIVRKDCLAGDGRFAAVTGDTDLEQNYVF